MKVILQLVLHLGHMLPLHQHHCFADFRESISPLCWQNSQICSAISRFKHAKLSIFKVSLPYIAMLSMVRYHLNDWLDLGFDIGCFTYRMRGSSLLALQVVHIFSSLID